MKTNFKLFYLFAAGIFLFTACSKEEIQEDASFNAQENVAAIEHELFTIEEWENTEDAEIHGPHSSTKMLKWQESGFFDKGMFCRKVGESSSFLDGKRIDFDLYI